MRKSIAEAIMSTNRDLNKTGIVDDDWLEYMQSLCSPEIEKHTLVKSTPIKRGLKINQTT